MSWNVYLELTDCSDELTAREAALEWSPTGGIELVYHDPEDGTYLFRAVTPEINLVGVKKRLVDWGYSSLLAKGYPNLPIIAI